MEAVGGGERRAVFCVASVFLCCGAVASYDGFDHAPDEVVGEWLASACGYHLAFGGPVSGVVAYGVGPLVAVGVVFEACAVCAQCGGLLPCVQGCCECGVGCLHGVCLVGLIGVFQMLRMLAGDGMRVRAEGSRVYVFSGGRMTAVAVSIVGSASSGRV